MAGFLLKNLVHTGVSSGAVASTNLFTVPAGHIYLIKEGSVWWNKTAAGAGNFYFEISDGVTFRRVTDQYTSPAAAGNFMLNLSKGDPANQQAAGLLADPSTQHASIRNKVLPAGYIFRITNGVAVAGTLHININGVDYTI
jgi:hypothetical protein